MLKPGMIFRLKEPMNFRSFPHSYFIYDFSHNLIKTYALETNEHIEFLKFWHEIYPHGFEVIVE